MICYVPSQNNATWLPKDRDTESMVHGQIEISVIPLDCKSQVQIRKALKPLWPFIILEHDIYSVYLHQ